MTKTNLTLGITLALAGLLGTGCGSESPTGPSGLGGGLGQYDGIWVATTPGYPEKKLQMEIVSGELAHVYYEGFYDLLNCVGEPDVRLDPSPRPRIVGGLLTFAVSGSPISVTGQMSFTSPSDATGTADVDYDEGGLPCMWDGAPFSFSASKL